MGEIEVPDDMLWGAQTQRSLHHFHFPGETMPMPVVHAQVLVKKAAALTNMALGVLDSKKGGAIVKAADEALTRQSRRAFPAGGVADRLRHPDQHERQRGARQPRLRNPRRQARRGSAWCTRTTTSTRAQSSNDTFPTAMHVAAVIALERQLKPAVKKLRNTLDEKSRAFMRHRQDRPHPPAGRDAADAGPGVLGLCCPA